MAVCRFPQHLSQRRGVRHQYAAGPAGLRDGLPQGKGTTRRYVDTGCEFQVSFRYWINRQLSSRWVRGNPAPVYQYQGAVDLPAQGTDNLDPVASLVDTVIQQEIAVEEETPDQAHPAIGKCGSVNG